MERIIVGIDPGASGGIAVYLNGKVELHKMPKDLTRLKDYLEYLKELGNVVAFVEKLSIRPDDVLVSGGGVHMGKIFRIQKMMQNFEQLKATIQFSDIPFALVHPMKWQSALGLRKKGIKEEKADRKRRYKEEAAKLYPYTKQTLWSADATLIMQFGLWAFENDTNWLKKNIPSELHTKIF